MKDPAGSGNDIHVVYSDLICFQSIHIVHIAISYIVLLFFLIMTLLTTLLFFENRYTKDPSAK